MNKRALLTTAIAISLIASSCQKEQISSDQLLKVNATAYTAVTETPTTKAINASVLSGFTSFDSQQAWFDFTTVSSTDKGKASARNAWHLGFYSQEDNFPVNGTASNLLAYLNYSVNTQAKQINNISSLANGALTPAIQNQLNAAVALFDGGTFNMGDLSTFDFHREGQFVIGTPSNNFRFYLIRTAEAVQVHPEDPATTNFVIAAIRWTGSAYAVSYRPVNQSGTTWAWANLANPAVNANISKNSNRQSVFLNFTTGATDTIQPLINDWNLGLSAVILKRYINPDFGGGAYPFAIKGVVLNNNPAVKVYRVQTTTAADSAGATGPYDPNYNWQNDPALATANDITTQFDNFNAANIDDTKFSGNSQEEIGQYYRYLDMGNYKVFVDRFYVIKLQNGAVYKLRFQQLGGGSSTPVNNGIQIKYAKIATTP
ncbi:hypothetical protein [Sphingobacterium sp. LRF_L2]|uniref:hypothetical protein n=1 Tax=Sphingobacterium sp. LRF_L2 TaxID=3369421 RepID=UPI003F60A7B9